MSRARKIAGAVAGGAAVLAYATVGAYSVRQHPGPTPSPSSSSAPSAVVQPAQLKTTGCRTRAKGQLPDPACTPGMVDTKLTVADLCPHLHGTVVRAVSQSTKDKVRAAYGDQRPGEIDHLVSLELGGSNDISNLWPEDGKIPNPKDAIENRLHSEVCAGTITLAAAQLTIRTDWRKAR